MMAQTTSSREEAWWISIVVLVAGMLIRIEIAIGIVDGGTMTTMGSIEVFERA